MDTCGRRNHMRFSAPHSAEDVSTERAARETPRRRIHRCRISLVFDSVTLPKVASPRFNAINNKIIDAQYGKAESDGDSAKVRLSLIETPAARPQPSPC